MHNSKPSGSISKLQQYPEIQSSERTIEEEKDDVATNLQGFRHPLVPAVSTSRNISLVDISTQYKSKNMRSTLSRNTSRVSNSIWASPQGVTSSTSGTCHSNTQTNDAAASRRRTATIYPEFLFADLHGLPKHLGH